ncbi:hypothetical protein GCM10022222_76690 [Amycolatopsis ultiminotia]|uniref:Uncharacterized protein n=1 Tax=Amycolatopsis ultiminotia TaxID=543629 RepID=A0ABP6YBR4_9PSEU
MTAGWVANGAVVPATGWLDGAEWDSWLDGGCKDGWAMGSAAQEAGRTKAGGVAASRAGVTVDGTWCGGG